MILLTGLRKAVEAWHGLSSAGEIGHEKPLPAGGASCYLDGRSIAIPVSPVFLREFCLALGQ